MKNLFLLLLLLLFALPVCAANWKQIDDKEYVDLDSIEQYNEIYNLRSSNVQSFWIKSLNDKSSYFTDLEKRLDKKVWYNMTRYLVNCTNKTIGLKSITTYDLKGQTLENYEVSNYLIEWSSVVPDSRGEGYYYGVCQP